jgi:hypothetical protein
MVGSDFGWAREDPGLPPTRGVFVIEIEPFRKLRTLMEKHNGSCVSMFLPTQRTGMETQKAQLSLRNHIREAEHRLFLDNLSSRQVEEFL